ncbi:MAG: pilus assembly protein CpaE [Micromonosporaceae bacterium]|nr:pilus assembly protein CpaE [Micromonosporaceae bacterium]
MISIDLAGRLRRAGLSWHPAPGDRFAIPDRGLDDEIFVLSNMTIEVHDLPEGPIIGFNGTVEWALDDVAKEEAIWLPHEAQLRDLLGGTFRRLERTSSGYRVVAVIDGAEVAFVAEDAADAYGMALLRLIETVSADVAPAA